MSKQSVRAADGGNCLIPHIIPPQGNESPGSIIRKADWRPKDFTAFLPGPFAAASWLNLDARTSWTTVVFSLGREDNRMGLFALETKSPQVQILFTTTTSTDW